MAKKKIKWFDKNLKKAVCEAAKPVVEARTKAAFEAAKAMSAGYRTGIWHDPETGARKGDTQPKYRSNVRVNKYVPVGIVATANYSAMKDNAENNTLLKVVNSGI